MRKGFTSQKAKLRCIPALFAGGRIIPRPRGRDTHALGLLRVKKRKMHPLTRLLLEWMQKERHPYGITRITTIQPDGCKMRHLRALEKMGLLEERVPGIWYLTEKGLKEF